MAISRITFLHDHHHCLLIVMQLNLLINHLDFPDDSKRIL